MNQPTLTPRLRKMADLVEPAARIWDVGSDHAKLPVWLLACGKISFAVASDIRQNPLESAVKTAKAAHVDEAMRFVLCDGLEPPAEAAHLTDEIDTVTIAGMGGDTIAAILSRAPWVFDRPIRLLLQPMSSVEDLRAFLYSSRCTVLNEYLVSDRHRLYLVIEAMSVGVPETYDMADTRIGKHLPRDADFIEYADRELRRLKKELSGVRSDPDKSAAIREAMDRIIAAKEEAANDHC